MLGSLRKGLEVIDCFARQKTWSLAEPATTLGQTKPTVFRILKPIEAFAYVHRDSQTGRYSLATRFQSLASAAVQNEMAVLASVIQRRIPARRCMSASFMRAARRSACKPLAVRGLASLPDLLAHLPDEEIAAFTSRKLARFTLRTITAATALRQALRPICSQGWALDDEEMAIGLRCLSAPITDHAGCSCAKFAISAPAARMNPVRITELMPVVKATAAPIFHMLGGATRQDTATRAA